MLGDRAKRRPLDFGDTVGRSRFIEATTLRPNGQANRPCLRAPKDARRTRSGLNARLGSDLLVRELRDVRSLGCMFDGNGADVALGIDIE